MSERNGTYICRDPHDEDVFHVYQFWMKNGTQLCVHEKTLNESTFEWLTKRSIDDFRHITPMMPVKCKLTLEIEGNG